MSRTPGAKTKNRPGASTARRFSGTEREGIKQQIQRLDLHGHSKADIARQLKVSAATVTNLVDEINRDYHDAYVDDRKRWAMKATAAQLDVIRQAQEELAKLRARGHRTVMKEEGETPGDKGGPYHKRRVQVENPEVGGLLAIIQRGWQEIAAIHGVRELPAQVFQINLNNAEVNVFKLLEDAFYPPVGAGAVADLPAAEVVVQPPQPPEDA